MYTTAQFISPGEFALAPTGEKIFHQITAEIWTFIDAPTTVGRSPYLAKRQMQSETQQIKTLYYMSKDREFRIVDSDDAIFCDAQ